MPAEPVEVFLIFAHEDRVQLSALIKRLLPYGCCDKAIVHIDAKSQLWKTTRGAFLKDIPNVCLIENPVPVYWAHSSMLEAIALLIEKALREEFALAHLISGSDWPVKDKADRLKDWDGRSLIEAERNVQSERMARYWLDARFARYRANGLYHWRLKQAIDWVCQSIPPRRDEPWGTWHKGSGWWSLTSAACSHILPALDQAFQTKRLFATLCADEHLIQTILANQMPDNIRRDSKRATFWTGNSSSPRVLTAQDWPSIKSSGAWFARKVSRHVDPFFLQL